MLALLIAIALFIGLALLVLCWASDDLAGPGTLSPKSLAASWLLYVFHADTVSGAAWTGALVVDVPRAAALAVGAALIATGFAVFLAATFALVRHGDFAGLRTRRLVTAGPCSFSRHPQNVGWGVLLLGIAVAGRSVVALALVILFAAFVERYTRLEERQLQDDFGAPYDAYRASTPAALSLGQRRLARASTRARALGTPRKSRQH